MFTTRATLALHLVATLLLATALPSSAAGQQNVEALRRRFTDASDVINRNWHKFGVQASWCQLTPDSGGKDALDEWAERKIGLAEQKAVSERIRGARGVIKWSSSPGLRTSSQALGYATDNVPFANSALYVFRNIGEGDNSLNGAARRSYDGMAPGYDQLYKAPAPIENYECNSKNLDGLTRHIKELERRSTALHQRMARMLDGNGESNAEGSLSGRYGLAKKFFEREFEGQRFINMELNEQGKLASCAGTQQNMREFHKALTDAEEALKGLADYHRQQKQELDTQITKLKGLEARCRQAAG